MKNSDAASSVTRWLCRRHVPWLPGRLVLGLALGIVASQAWAWVSRHDGPEAHAQASDSAAVAGALPDQAHAMADVGYHFTHLWFAAEKKNWPLATFYLDETRSHLSWAVRLKPIRKTSGGEELNLTAILEAIDNTFLTKIRSAIQAGDSTQFVAAYRQTLEGCYGCHKASEKPYLRLQVPQSQVAGVIRFELEAETPR